ncbi:hypothetical protein JW979_13485 [bacterium]|nr:hypothetical protein [candidate division CSSED10-310 bacterium]
MKFIITKKISVVLFFLLMISNVTYATPPMETNFYSGIAKFDYKPDNSMDSTHLDYLSELYSICTFLSEWQVKDLSDPEFGGMIEDEYRTGEDRIVQTDNTQEAIYVWSRYYFLTGNAEFSKNIEDAWTYCEAFPAYMEESEYYRVWNCGWGLCCGIWYEKAYQDDIHADYSATCAQYIFKNADALPFEANPPGIGVRNALTVAWAAWNLMEYSQFISDETYELTAIQLAEKVKTWVEEDTENIQKVSWALSGGVAAACVLDVQFRDDPVGARDWADMYLINLPQYYNPEDFNPDAWILAWDSWAAMAQNALWRTTDDFSHRRLSFEQSDFIRSYDTDGDGGIPTNPSHPDNEDETWVSTYVVLMGFAALEASPDFRITMNNSEIEAGDLCQTSLEIYGPGLTTDVDLYLILEIAGTYYFYPYFSADPFAIPLQVELDFVLTEWLGLEEFYLLNIPMWPAGTPPTELAWWGGMTRHGTSDLIGNVVHVPWRSL